MLNNAWANLPLDDVKDHIKLTEDRPHPRHHLGCSQLGKECRLDLWHDFRWSGKAEFDADTHLRFLDGHRSEDVMAGYLKAAGFNLQTHQQGQQYRVSLLGGHLAGSLDGIIVGGMHWHKDRRDRTVWECKATNETKYKQLIKLVNELGDTAHHDALRQWDEIYYAQAQAYMYLTGIESHWLTCCTPGVRQFTGVLTELNRDYAEMLIAKAETIITSDAAPARAFEDPTFFKAKFLNHRDIIYQGEIPKPNWRNSMFCYPDVSEDKATAEWFDESVGIVAPPALQHQCPPHHLWNPSFITYAECIEYDQADYPRWAKYQLPNGHQFYHCVQGLETDNVFNSHELRFLNQELICDPNINAIRSGLAAKVTGNE